MLFLLVFALLVNWWFSARFVCVCGLLLAFVGLRVWFVLDLISGFGCDGLCYLLVIDVLGFGLLRVGGLRL